MRGSRGRRARVPPKPTLSPEHQFGRELDWFERECEAATKYLLAYLTIHAAARKRATVLRALNDESMFWNTVLSALQLALHIALGRIFDQKSSHSLDRLIGLAQDQPSIFSKAALARRRGFANENGPAWQEVYLPEAYDPTASDFRMLKRQVQARRGVYNSRYRDIRDLFAHATGGDAREIFAKANTKELKSLVGFLSQLDLALSNLLMNGHKPVVNRADLRDPGISAQAESVLRRLARTKKGARPVRFRRFRP